MSTSALRARAEEIVRLCAAMDTDALVAQYADDVVVEFPFRPGREPKRYEGRAAAAEFMAFAHRSFSEYSMHAEAVHPVPEQRTVIVEATGRGIAVPTGRVYEQRYVLVIAFDESDRIVRWREYYDPAAVIAAFAAR